MTFEEYVGEKWEMSYRRADQIITCAKAAENLKNFSSFPSKESHVRPLLKLTSDEERAARKIGEIYPVLPTKEAHVRPLLKTTL